MLDIDPQRSIFAERIPSPSRKRKKQETPSVNDIMAEPGSRTDRLKQTVLHWDGLTIEEKAKQTNEAKQRLAEINKWKGGDDNRSDRDLILLYEKIIELSQPGN